jgi:uncharacterized protein
MRNLIRSARKRNLESLFAEEGPTDVVVKLTTACNLRCVYCYTKSENRGPDLDLASFERLFDQIACTRAAQVNCLFHGGEPLLRLPLMIQCMDLIRSKYYSSRVRFAVQTNATLITDKVMRVLEQYNVPVGISLDGVQAVSDQTRRYCNGKGAFSGIYRGIKVLQRHNQSFGAISVITEQNVTHIIEYLEWCLEHGLRSVKLVPRYPLGRAESDILRYKALEGDLIEAYKGIIEWLLRTNEQLEPHQRIFVREIQALVFNILSPELNPFWCMRIPCCAGSKHISINVNGDIYVCDCLIGHKEYVIGNITETPLSDMLSSPLAVRFRNRSIREMEACSKCAIVAMCYGGCPAQNLLEGAGWHERPTSCEWIKAITLFLKDKMANGARAELLCGSQDRLLEAQSRTRLDVCSPEAQDGEMETIS